MAQITICDLCKKQVKKRTGLSKLSLSAYINKLKRQVEAELCESCVTELVARLDADEDIAPREPLQSPVKTSSTQVGSVVDSSQVPTLAVASKPQKSASGKATEELLDDEMVIIPPAKDLRKGSKDARKTNAEIVKKRGSCPHQFKRYENGVIICIDAPPGVQGEFATTRGCGKKLREDEV
jgi:hypothetical protein